MAQTIWSTNGALTSIASITNVTVWTFAVPANTLKGPGGQKLRLQLYGEWINNSGANRVYTVVGSFGGVVFAEDALPSMPTSASRRAAFIEVTITYSASTSQRYGMLLGVSALSGVTTGSSGDWGAAPLVPPSMIENTGTINTAAAQTLLIAIRSDAATATQSWIERGGNLELV